MIVVEGFMSIIHCQQNSCTCTLSRQQKPTKRSCVLRTDERPRQLHAENSFVCQHLANEERCYQHTGYWKFWTNLSLATIIQNTKCFLLQLQSKGRCADSWSKVLIYIPGSVIGGTSYCQHVSLCEVLQPRNAVQDDRRHQGLPCQVVVAERILV